MSTNTLSWRTAELDSPWRRLVWTLPSALLICAITFVWFAFSMHQPAKHTDEPVPINAELVELPAPAPAEQKIVTPPPVAKNIPQPKVMQSPTPEPQPSAIAAPAEPSPPQATAVTPASTPAPAVAGETHGAKAISQPLPVIPDELRQEYMNVTAVARFEIAEDGTSGVTLIKPTQNPRLNRLLLDSLKNWRFTPALKDGKPVATSEDKVIRVNVR